MVFFDSSSIYIESATTAKEKIVKINAVIDALFAAAVDAAKNNGINEYSLDDGQTKIKEVYRSAEDVMKAIKVFEAQKQYYINQLNGRTARLVDSKNFPSNRRNYGRY